jgi:hypothetical protein
MRTVDGQGAYPNSAVSSLRARVGSENHGYSHVSEVQISQVGHAAEKTSDEVEAESSTARTLDDP